MTVRRRGIPSPIPIYTFAPGYIPPLLWVLPSRTRALCPVPGSAGCVATGVGSWVGRPVARPVVGASRPSEGSSGTRATLPAPRPGSESLRDTRTHARDALRTADLGSSASSFCLLAGRLAHPATRTHEPYSRTETPQTDPLAPRGATSCLSVLLPFCCELVRTCPERRQNVPACLSSRSL